MKEKQIVAKEKLGGGWREKNMGNFYEFEWNNNNNNKITQ